jgi:ribonuclease BN (tRNA processing enzyme)
LLRRLVAPPLFAHELGDIVDAVEELPIGELRLGAFAIRTRAQERHTHPSVGFRVEDALAYCTDTGYDPGCAEFARGCRHLLHEAFWMDEAADGTHSTAAEAARIARAAGVGGLTLIHLHPRLRDEDRFLRPALEIFPKSRVGQDLDDLR